MKNRYWALSICQRTVPSAVRFFWQHSFGSIRRHLHHYQPKASGFISIFESSRRKLPMVLLLSLCFPQRHKITRGIVQIPFIFLTFYPDVHLSVKSPVDDDDDAISPQVVLSTPQASQQQGQGRTSNKNAMPTHITK